MAKARVSLNHDKAGASLARDVKIFISHSSRDAGEALDLELALDKEKFDVWPYESRLAFGNTIWPEILRQIPLSSFFLLLVSDHSIISEAVQKELGLALAARADQGGFRPIIIPIYAANASWRTGTGTRPLSMPIRDFETGEVTGAFDLASIRGHDPIANPGADKLDHLVKCMRPRIAFITPDAYDERLMEEIGFFDLYKGLFDESVRVSDDEFLKNLKRDTNVAIPVALAASPLDLTYYTHSELRKFTYQHVSFCPIYLLYERAIAFAFLTYTQSRRLIFGSYIGVQESWRSDGTARKFVEDLKREIVSNYPECQGMVFEVESFDVKKVENIISYIEKEKVFRNAEDKVEIRNFVRVWWFEGEGMGANFFIDREGRPLEYSQPCLDPELPRKQWQKQEKTQWLGWLEAGKMTADNAAELWPQVVDYVIVEMIAKAQVFSYPNIGFDYLVYANDLKKRVLKKSKSNGVAIGKILRRKDRALLKRWRALGIKISM